MNFVELNSVASACARKELCGFRLYAEGALWLPPLGGRKGSVASAFLGGRKDFVASAFRRKERKDAQS